METVYNFSLVVPIHYRSFLVVKVYWTVIYNSLCCFGVLCFSLGVQ